LTTISGISWNGSLWIATGSAANGGSAIATSPDGQIWSAQTVPALFVDGTAITSRRVLPQTDNLSARSLYANTLTISTINGTPYSGSTPPAGPAKAIQYSDGAGNFQADSTFTWNASKSALQGGSASNTITFNTTKGGLKLQSNAELELLASPATGNLLLQTSTLQITVAGTQSSGQVLTTDGTYARWQTPSGGGSAAAGQVAGSIQYTDGDGNFQASSTFTWNASKSVLQGGPADNKIGLGEGAEGTGVSIISGAGIELNGSGGHTQLSASTLQITIGSGDGLLGQVLTSDGFYAKWQTPSGGGSSMTVNTQIISVNPPDAKTYNLSASDVGSFVVVKGTGSNGLFSLNFTNDPLSPFPIGGTFFIKSIDFDGNLISISFNGSPASINPILYGPSQVGGMQNNGYMCIANLVSDLGTIRLNIY
jgi:hypothetical protein